jgi:hypothetical protein
MTAAVGDALPHAVCGPIAYRPLGDSSRRAKSPKRYSETGIQQPESFRPLLHGRMRSAGGTQKYGQPFPVRITCRILDNNRENFGHQY